MASASSRKGRRLEGILVEWLEQHSGQNAERCWSSDGRSRGLHQEVDVVLEMEGYDLYFQCKNDEVNPDYLFVDETHWLIDEAENQRYLLITENDMSILLHSWSNNKQFSTSTDFPEIKRARVLSDAKPNLDAGLHFQCIKKNYKPMMFVASYDTLVEINYLHE